MQIIDMDLKNIHPPTLALKYHTKRQLEQLEASIKQFGFNDPIAVDENSSIIEGLGRYLVAKRLKMKTIPVICLLHLTETQKKAYRIAHNKICLNTGFDLDALRIEFQSLSELPESLLECMGFEAIEVQELLSIPTLPDLAPELSEYLEQNAKSVACPHCGGMVYV